MSTPLLGVAINLLIAGGVGLGASNAESTQQAISFVAVIITFLLLELGDKS